MKLYIPYRIKIGFIEQKDAVNRLGYINHDENRKQREWKDKTIEAIDIDNKEHSGFIIRSLTWDDYGCSLVRIYDNRGFEFEITSDNLLFILINTQCLEGQLKGNFVYGWNDKDAFLIPTDCKEYKESIEFTQLKKGRLTDIDMTVGYLYQDKESNYLIYLGRYPYYHFNKNKREYIGERRYIFIDDKDEIKVMRKLKEIGKKVNKVENIEDKLEVYRKSREGGKPKEILIVNLKDKDIETRYTVNDKHVFEKRKDGLFNVFDMYKWLGDYYYHLIHVWTIGFKDSEYVMEVGGTKERKCGKEELLSYFIDIRIKLDNGLLCKWEDI